MDGAKCCGKMLGVKGGELSPLNLLHGDDNSRTDNG